MKKLIRRPELMTAMAIIASLVTLTAAAEIPSGKGLATLLTKPASTSARKVSPKGAACASCADVYITRADLTARGANNRDAKAVRHTCGSCNTTFATVGTGKSKRDVASHQCAMPAIASNSCCVEGQTTACASK